MVNIGIIGVGGIAGAHLAGYRHLPQARIVALCDKIPDRAAGKAGEMQLNIGTTGGTAVQARPYTDYRALLDDPEVEAVDICLPTDLHAEVAVAALQAGKHVLSEKPMALSVADCDRMIAAAEAAGRILMIAQCIRFCPEYQVVKAMADSGDYGQVTHALFRRLSAMPRWSTDHWMEDPARSGGGIFDLHIHDADYITYLLGLPTAVDVRGVENAQGIGQVMAAYHYPHTQAVFAEGGWSYHAGFPFRMTFTVCFETATVEYDSARGPLTIFRDGQDPEVPALPPGDLYTNEIAYFLACVATNTPPRVVTAFDARETIRMVAAEAASVRSGRPVAL
jgi:predicted dehydrogenase